jgi:hypothetical protein
MEVDNIRGHFTSKVLQIVAWPDLIWLRTWWLLLLLLFVNVQGFILNTDMSNLF